jgi:two-component system response regulator FixJ
MLQRQPLVLVANDDDAIGDALQFALQLENFEVHVHRSGAELVANKDLSRADCLILQDRTPTMDGLEVMHYLLTRGLIPPAILLTANATPRLLAQAKAAGILLVTIVDRGKLTDRLPPT